jgi:hypothetical protein
MLKEICVDDLMAMKEWLLRSADRTAPVQADILPGRILAADQRYLASFAT